MNISIDLRSDIPIYLQIVEQVRQQVASGGLKPGEQLPTVRAMASELRINFNTVSRSYRLLDEAGIISTQQGRGTYILEMPPPEIAERLRQESIAALARRYLDQSQKLGFTVAQAVEHLGRQASAPHIEPSDFE
jgi:GntR family transcriptional regulator